MSKSKTLYIAARRHGMTPGDARTLVGSAVRLSRLQRRAFNTWAQAWETDNERTGE